jgi:hypothetical protein
MFKRIFYLVTFSLFLLQCDIPELNDIIPPTVSIAYPTEGTVLSANTQIKIEAFDDELNKVWAYVDSNLIGETRKRPFIIDLDITPYKDGLSHTIQVYASDKTGNFSVSPLVNVIIAETDDVIDPTITIVNPQNGQTVEDTVRILALAEDERAIEKVAFFIDGDSVGQDESYPYNYNWDTKPYADSTNHTIHAKAFDTGGNSGISPVVSVTVFPSSTDQTAPTVIALYPINSSTVTGTITIRADAEDNFGINRVEFYIDGVLNSTDTDGSDGWSSTWNTAAQADSSSHSIFFKAYDNAGNMGSAFITVTVVP